MGVTYAIEAMPGSYKIGAFDVAFRIYAISDSRATVGYMAEIKIYEDICQWCCKHFIEHFVISEYTSRIVAGGCTENEHSYNYINDSRKRGAGALWDEPLITYYELRCHSKDAVFFKMVWA